MKRLLVYAVLLSLMISPAIAQNTTATGVGVANSSSTSASRATAIGGGQGIGTGGQASATINSNVPASSFQTVNNTGTQTIKNVPTVFAPGLAAAGLETCLGSISAGAGVVGTGATFGTTIPDPGCAARLDARTLWSFGLKKAAIARLCLNPDNYRSMPEICVQYLPQQQVAATSYRGPGPIFGVTPSYYSTQEPPLAPTYSGGPILLVEGKTGQNRLCNDYDERHTTCKTWAYTHRYSPPKKKTGPTPPSDARPEAEKKS